MVDDGSCEALNGPAKPLSDFVSDRAKFRRMWAKSGLLPGVPVLRMILSRYKTLPDPF